MRTTILLASLMLAFAVNAADDYVPGPDSKTQERVPKGEVTKYTFNDSKVFPGTTREYWVYVPKQYDSNKPACLMVFQDGIQYNAPVVFDNLIPRGEIPVTIGVFVMPGRVVGPSTNSLDRFNRSYEYDGLGDNYARLLIEELLPQVTKKYNISKHPDDHAIAGASSGAIAAFTAAWERPDYFRRVFSSIGTYVGLRGGNNYPTLIRKTEPKPLRIFLQDGSNDLNIYGGNWFLANQEMLSALQFSGYEVTNVWGDGGHNGKHATAVFPDGLRWLWKDHPKPITAGIDSQQPLMDVLLTNGNWRLASAGRWASALAVNKFGQLFFYDPFARGIYEFDIDGKVSEFVKAADLISAMSFGPDGRLYAAQPGLKRIAAYEADGSARAIAAIDNGFGLTVTHTGEIYCAHLARLLTPFEDVVKMTPRILRIDPQNGQLKSIAKIPGASCFQLVPDQTFMNVAYENQQFIDSIQIKPERIPAIKQKYFHLHLEDGATGSGAAGMTVDTQGRLYVATDLGIQVCDQAGRVNYIIAKPRPGKLRQLALGGVNRDTLYAICGPRIYARQTKAKGVLSFEPPIKPPAPRL